MCAASERDVSTKFNDSLSTVLCQLHEHNSFSQVSEGCVHGDFKKAFLER